MNNVSLKSLAAAVLATVALSAAQAQVRITEVSPWSSGASFSPIGADWFELTNIGSSAVSISGWTMDDDSALANSAPLAGVSSIAVGESVVFIELAAGGNATSLINLFKSTWFGASVPAGLQIGTYTQGVAGGVGLGQGGDQVNIFSGVAGTLQARVLFGASDMVSPFQTFDNAAGLNNATISQLSVLGTNGAFAAINDAAEIGSPGRIATAVPEPETYALFAAGLLAVGSLLRRRQG